MTTNTTVTPESIGTRVGAAIARTARRERITDTRWTGIEAQDADQMEAAGLVMGSPEWSAAERAAEAEYRRIMAV